MIARAAMAATLMLLATVPVAADPVARGLAARARVEAGERAVIDKLRRAAARGAASNPDEAAAAAGVTLSASASADTSLTRVYPAAANAALFATAGGRARAGGTGNAYLYFPVASVAPATNGNVGGVTGIASASAWGWAAEFATDADRLELRFNSCAACRYRVAVDGRYVDKVPAAGIDYVANVRLDFAGKRQPRVIRLEASDTAALRAVAVPATSNLWRPAAAAERVTVLATGDSWSEGQGATSPGILGWPQVLGRAMGWSDVRQVAVGGTGYLSTGGALGRSALRDQIGRWFAINDDLKGADVDLVTVAAGYNDYTFAAAAIGAEALADLRAIRRACPNAVIVVMGPHAGARGPDAKTIEIEDALRGAVAAMADRRVQFVGVSGGASPWIFGTGRVGATNGSGNSDVMIGGDGVHPSDAGHALYAARAAAAIRALLAAM